MRGEMKGGNETDLVEPEWPAVEDVVAFGVLER